MTIYERADAQRKALLARDKATREALMDAYKTVDGDLQKRCAALTDLIEIRQAAGEDISRAWLLKDARFSALMDQVSQQIKAMAYETVDQTTKAAQANFRQGALDGLALAADAEGRAVVAGVFNRLNAKATENMVAYLANDAPLGQLLARLADEMPAEAVKRAKDVLLIGVATGQSPRVIAGHFRNATGQSLVRSITISRTEALRAYRQAALQTYVDSDVITAYQWLCTKSARTCPACLAMDGRVFDKADPFMAHVRCRCTCVPVVGAPRERATGEDWLREQDDDTQNEIMGEAAASAWRTGQVRLNDFVGVRQNKEWGASVYCDSLKGARERAKARKNGGSGVQNDTNPNTPRSFSTAKASRSVLEPVGQRVSEIAQIGADKRNQVFRNAVGAVDAVQGFGDKQMPDLAFVFDILAQGDAAYNNKVSPAAIALSRNARDPVFSVMHEVGHYVADKGFGQTGRDARFDVPAFQAWRDAIQSSKAVASLQATRTAAGGDEDVSDYADYLLRPSEIWARSYAQYVAVRSGDRAALNAVADRRLRPTDATPYFARQWEDDDFAPIATALDDLFKAQGWVKNK